LIDFGLLVLEKKIIKNFLAIFTLLLLPPLGEGQLPLFELTLIPPPKDDLCKVWLKLAQWFCRRRFLKDPTLISHFLDYLLFE
jgi:hypothetical protein